MKPKTLQLCKDYLFEDLPENMGEQFKQRIIRIRGAYTYWLEFPDMSPQDIREHLIGLGSGRTQSFEDIKILKALVGDVNRVSKDWHRARAVQMAEETYKIAKEKKDARGMAAANANYGKFTNLDKEDVIEIPYEELVFTPWEPTENPEASGFKKVPGIDERIKKLEKRYSEDLGSQAIEVPFQEIDESEETDISK